MKKEVKEFIKENYLSVSDRDIADQFGVSPRAVGEMRRRAGLKKDGVATLILREKRRSEVRLLMARDVDFDNFWSGA